MKETGTAARPKYQFKDVKVAPRLKGSSNRDPEGATVYPTGRTLLNVAGSEELADLAQAENLKSEALNIILKADEEAGVVALYPVPPNTPNSLSIRWNAKRRTAALHLGDVLQQFPALRPTARRQCRVMADSDGQGKRCLMIALKSSLIKQRARSDRSALNTALRQVPATV